MLLVSHSPDTRLCKSAETKARAPVGDLPDGDGIDALVDTTDALPPVDVHERRHRAGDLFTRSGGLVPRHLDRLHAGAETHSGIGLRETASHTACDAADEGRGAQGLRVEFGFGGDEEEDGTFGAGFDPGPGDETLVDCS